MPRIRNATRLGVYYTVRGASQTTLTLILFVYKLRPSAARTEHPAWLLIRLQMRTIGTFGMSLAPATNLQHPKPQLINTRQSIHQTEIRNQHRHQTTGNHDSTLHRRRRDLIKMDMQAWPQKQNRIWHRNLIKENGHARERHLKQQIDVQNSTLNVNTQSKVTPRTRVRA